jgi:hypothetical protein
VDATKISSAVGTPPPFYAKNLNKNAPSPLPAVGPDLADAMNAETANAFMVHRSCNYLDKHPRMAVAVDHLVGHVAVIG